MPVWAVVLVILLVAFVVYVSWRREQERRAGVRRWAHGAGWRHRPGKVRDPGHPWPLFRRGHTRYARDHLEARIEGATAGVEHASVRMFEYHYAETTGSGDSSSTTSYHHVCALVSPGLDLGEVTIRDEHLGDKLARMVGFDDIDFEDHEFSSRFAVTARNRRDAYALVDGRMMRLLLANPGWRIETRGPQMLVWRRKRPQWEDFAALAQLVRRFLAELPRTLVNEERSRRGLPPVLDAGNAAGREEWTRG